MSNVQRVLGRLALPLAVVGCLAVSATIVFNYLYQSKVGNDFSVYLRTANAPVADAYGFPGEFPFPYMPTMLALLKAFVEPALAAPGFLLFTGFVCLSLLLYVRALKPYVPLTVILLCFIAPAIMRGALTGQVSIILAALMIWGMAQKDRLLTGFAFGLVAAIKPQLVLMAPLFFILERDWKAFGWAAATFAWAVALSLLAFGVQPWFDWVASMPKFHDAVMAISAGGIGTSPALWAEHRGLWPIPFIVLGVVLGALVTIFAERGDALRNAAIISLGSLLAAPYSLAYDLVVILPFLGLMVLRGNIFAALAMGTPFQIIPMAVAAYGVLPRKPSMRPKEPLGVVPLHGGE